MDERILFQTIDGAIQQGMREGFEFAAVDQPTLRDQFAMAALTGLEPGHVPTTGAVSIEDFAADAYRLADAMMEARKETHNAD